MHANHDDNNNTPKRYSTRILQGVGILLIGVAIAITFFKYVDPKQGQAEDLDDFLYQVQKRGGALVRCEHGSCRDIRTHSFAGFTPPSDSPDGMYIVYPEGSVSDEELQREYATVKRLLETRKAEPTTSSAG